MVEIFYFGLVDVEFVELGNALALKEGDVPFDEAEEDGYGDNGEGDNKVKEGRVVVL